MRILSNTQDINDWITELCELKDPEVFELVKKTVNFETSCQEELNESLKPWGVKLSDTFELPRWMTEDDGGWGEDEE